MKNKTLSFFIFFIISLFCIIGFASYKSNNSPKPTRFMKANGYQYIIRDDGENVTVTKQKINETN